MNKKSRKIVRLASNLSRREWNAVKYGIDRVFDEATRRIVLINGKEAEERAIWFIEHP